MSKWKNIGHVTVVDVVIGERRQFGDIASAAFFLRHRTLLADDRTSPPLFAASAFVVLDQHDLRIPISVYERLIEKARQRSRQSQDFEFRNGPVPGVRRHYRKWGKRVFRHPKTMAELREIAAGDELGPPARNRYVPTAYDDIYKSAGDDRSWKRYRKTQWRVS